MKLSLQNVEKSYPTPAEPLQVLRGVTLTLAPPTTLAILGPSGSGKSTLLNILGTLDMPTAGAVRFDDTDPFALTAGDLASFRSKQIGFVFQDHHLLPQLTAIENVLLPALAQGSVKQPMIERAEELLRRVGLVNRATHVPAELSGGERQRVAIARALINSPSLLLADEPTGNLDPRTAATIVDLLLEIARERQMLLVAVTHNPELATRFSQSLTMHDGRLQ